MRTLTWALLALGLMSSSVALAGEPGGRAEYGFATGKAAAARAKPDTARAEAGDRSRAYLVTRSAIRLPAPTRRPTSQLAAAPLGYSFLKSLRIETSVSIGGTGDAPGELAVARALNNIAPAAGGRLDRATSTIDLVQDFETGGPWTPFFLGGIGTTQLTRSDGLDIEEVTLTNDLLFDFHLGAGVAFRLSERVNMIAGYRYVSSLGSVAGFEDSEANGRRLGNSGHVLGISVRIPFGPVS